jgi:RNA polymerase sigma factor (sigma-70 family)
MTPASGFPATRWTLITAAGDQGSQAADEALAELCQAYWYPLYAFVRRQGNSPDEAQDLTQEFFAHFLERRSISYADPSRGRFRSFVLTCMKHFLADLADRRNAEKRGGRERAVTLDLSDAEYRYSRALADRDTPEKLFEREWARTLIVRVTADVRTAFGREGRVEYFDRLKQFVPGNDEAVPYSEVARQLGTSDGALKVAIHRLRRRYREMFRAEIAHPGSRPWPNR